MSLDTKGDPQSDEHSSEFLNEDLLCLTCGGLSVVAVNTLYRKEGGLKRPAKRFKVRMRTHLREEVLIYVGACRGCALICDAIDALQLNIDAIEDIVIGYGLKDMEFLQTICMKLCFKDESTAWFQFYCTPGMSCNPISLHHTLSNTNMVHRLDQKPPRLAISNTLTTVSGSTASFKALKWTLGRLQECKCLQSQREPCLPSRVLDLGTSDSASAHSVNLIEMNGRMGRYVCLSYCWGKCTSLTTTKENYSQHLAGIQISSMARTHREAIDFTRRLGVRYLWIDALCIVQGDDIDWQSEASKMHDYYRNAELTLAANLGVDSEAGLYAGSLTTNEVGREFNSLCLVHDSSPSTRVCVRQALSHADIFNNELDAQGQCSPLMMRAWVYQERMLSSRYLHFGKELIWECACNLTCECGVLGNSKEYSALGGMRRDKSRLLETRKEDADKSLDRWNDAVLRYSGLKLTYHSDRLPAIAGIAQLFSQFDLGPYYAGLWRRKFASQLLWFADSKALKSRPQQSHVPTWSWASANGQIFNSLDPKIPIECKIINIDCKETTPGSFGQVKSARLTVHGSIVIVRHKWEPPQAPHTSWIQGRHMIVFEDGESDVVIPDYAWYSNGCVPPDAPYPAPITKNSSSLKNDEELQILHIVGCYFLLLRRISSEEQDYERVGLLMLRVNTRATVNSASVTII
jgi:hypothetical protein